MTRGDREQLAQLIKRQARLLISNVAVREAEMLADAEAKLAAKYNAGDEAWAHITAAASAAVDKADAEVAAICHELGIPDDFRPAIGVHWYKRGENAEKDRRSELRKVAVTSIAAAGKRAKLAIESRMVDQLGELVAGTLETADAQAFLSSLPTPAELMPTLTIEALEAGGRP